MVILGDWNEKVDKYAYQISPNIIGHFGISKTNSRGERLLEFAEKYTSYLLHAI